MTRASDIAKEAAIIGADTILSASYADSTIHEVAKQMRKLQDLIAEYGVDRDDWVEGTLLFAGACLARRVRPTTIRSYVGQVEIGMRIAGRLDDLRDPRMQLLRKGLARLKAKDGEEARAIPATVDDVNNLVRQHGATSPLDTAVAVIAFATASRIADVERIRADCIEVFPHPRRKNLRRLRITWLERKDGARTSGTEHNVAVPAHWAEVIQKAHALLSGAGARGRPRSELPLLGEMADVSRILVKPLTKHSFRRGAAQLIAQMCGDIETVKAMTLHRSTDALLHYVPDLFAHVQMRVTEQMIAEACSIPGSPPTPIRTDIPAPIPYMGDDDDSAPPIPVELADETASEGATPPRKIVVIGSVQGTPVRTPVRTPARQIRSPPSSIRKSTGATKRRRE